MLIEKKLYDVLNNSTELIELMDTIRGKSMEDTPIYYNTVPQGLKFQADAPIIRITFVQDRLESSDDDDNLTQSTLQVDFWTNTLSQSDRLTPVIKGLLRKNGFYQFDNARKKDPDSGESTDKQLIMNTIWVKTDPY